MVTSADICIVPNHVTHIISVAFALSYFAVLVLDIVNEAVKVFDGKDYPVSTWLTRATHVLNHTGLVALNKKRPVHLQSSSQTAYSNFWDICPFE